MYKLIIEDDEGKTTVVPITRDEITLGRKEGNNIRLTERNISRQHARLFTQNSMVYVEDLDSYNGIRVNGDRIEVKTPVGIREGDLIEIGDYHLAVQMDGSDAPGLATSSPSSDEATQRVALGSLGGNGADSAREEVTAQVTLAPPAHHHSPEPASHAAHGDLGYAPTEPHLDSMPMGGPLRMDITQDGAPDPSMMGGTEPHLDTAPRPEPTAIIRTSQLNAQAGPETQYPRLVVVSTSLAGRAFNLTKDETVIGRTEDNDLQIDHRSVSRNHAKIVREGGRYTVVDLKSANGVLVNGEEYARIDLRKGDIIELGHVKLRFVEAGERFELSAADIERMSRDEGPDADGFAQNDPTSMVTGRVGVRPAGQKKLPVKLIAIVAGVLVLLTTVGVLVFGGSSKQQPQPTPPADKPPEAAPSQPEDPTPPPSKKQPRNP
ncbi:MAG: FHA domain-containing protein, partial [Myxococcota bacterium]